MKLIPEAFLCLTLAGLWPLTHWKSRATEQLYKMYTLVLMLLMLLIIISLTVELLLFTSSIDDFVESCFLTLSAINGCVKCANIILRRDRVFNLIKMLNEEFCLPSGIDELRIRSSYDELSRRITIMGMLACFLAAGSMAIAPALFSRDGLNFIMKAWRPYNASDNFSYWCTYAHHLSSLMTMAFWNSTNDILISCFMVQICLQLDLLSHRLMILPETVESSKFSSTFQHEVVIRSVQHHLYIFKLVDCVENVFAPCILSQYCLNTIVLCVTIYKLTTVQSDLAKLMFTFMYLSAMILQLFYYSWFGNEVQLKSLQLKENMFKGNWTKLSNNTLKELLIIATISSSPLYMTCGPFIKLSNHSLISILKVSYSALNVLKKWK